MTIQGGLIRIFFSLDHQIETFDAEEKNTKYRCVIPMGICVFFFWHKFAHGAKYFHCGKLFTISNSTIHLIL
jgi:hypothetical protein